MHEHPVTACDLVIIGCGPTGAVLAGLAARRGLRVVVVEKNADLYPLPRAVQCDAEVVRILQEFGCAEDLLATSILNDGLSFTTADRTPFLSFTVPPTSPYGWPTSIFFHQPTLERMLRATLADLGVDVRLACPMTCLEHDSDGVSVTVASGEVIRAAYAVGCDGARSATREAMRSTLVDFGFQESWLVVDLFGVEPAVGLPTRCLQVCDPSRPHTVVPMPGLRFRFEFMFLPGETESEMQDPAMIRALLAPWIDPDAVEVERAAAYTFRGAIADSWRRGRVLLAGDAAHQTPPFLGQGMCTGLRDAANLAWKLDAVVRGGAGDELLDTYQAERSGHAEAVIAAAVEFGKLICVTDPEEAAARDAAFTAVPTDGGEAPDFLPKLAPGAGIAPSGGDLSPQPTLSGVRLDDLVGPRFLLVTRTGLAEQIGFELLGDISADTITVLSAAEHPELLVHLGEAEACLVRPDRYVAGRGAPAELADQLRALLRPAATPAA